MQLLAKFSKILYMGFRATLNFRKFKVALNPMYRIFENFAKSWISSCLSTFYNKARFKRRILHAPNRIAKLTACKMRRLNQLNATHFNSMRVSRIFDWSSRICDWASTVDLNAAFYMYRIELKSSWIIYVCSNGNLKHVARAQQFYSAKQCDA